MQGNERINDKIKICQICREKNKTVLFKQKRKQKKTAAYCAASSAKRFKISIWVAAAILQSALTIRPALHAN